MTNGIDREIGTFFPGGFLSFKEEDRDEGLKRPVKTVSQVGL